MTSLRCFTAYDVRGRIPDDFDASTAAHIALAFTEECQVKKMVLGHDMRLTSPELSMAIIQLLTEQGVEIIDIGLCGTEEVYHAVFSGTQEGIDGGIMITASHNPAEYNGMKIVQRQARPVSSSSGLQEIAKKAGDKEWVATQLRHRADSPAVCRKVRNKQAYLDLLLSLADSKVMKPLKLVVNSGNGCAGPIIDLLEPYLPFEFIRLHHEPDGHFPNGVPNPLLPEKRETTSQAVREHGADMGIAWDGDFDRCFLYDETGRFLEGYYIVGLLATSILQQQPHATILHDPRLTWNTIEMVTQAGGVPAMTRTGHAFIKEKMREMDAVYGGEMSAHHYFREFGYCDSGMLPWLLVCRLLSVSGRPLSTLCDERLQAYPVSGEINSTVKDPDAVLARIEANYKNGEKDWTDGISIEFPQYRFNVRKSNTEPVLRLNVETRGDEALLKEKTDELLALIRS